MNKSVSKKTILSILAWICFAGILLIVTVNVTIHLTTASYIYQTVENAPIADAALVPGAAILEDGQISPIFRDRINTAIALFKAGRVLKILVSGNNDSLSYDEVNPARDYLIANGIPEQDIFLDHAGFDTYSTMYRAKAIFNVSSVIIVTQAFHLPRALFIARALGIDAIGVNADNGPSDFRNYVREVFADEKAVLDLMIHRVPKYLGAPIPIDSTSGNM